MKNLILFATFLFLSINLIAQNSCSNYYPFKEGVKYEITNFDKKDKVTGKIKYEVKDVTGNSVVLFNEAFDAKGEPLLSSEFSLICTDDGISIDFKSLISNEILERYKAMNMEIDISGTNIDIPNNLSEGQTLPDAEIKLSMSMASVNMKMSVKMTNRKVLGNETITTSAGTFDCAVLTYNTEVSMGMNVTMSSKQWLAKGVGMVKSEEYNDKGKLMTKSVLTKFED